MRSNIDPLDFKPDREDNEGSGGFLGMALLAVAVGAGSALLFAPAEGARTRKVVQGRFRDLRGGANVALERVQRELGRREARRRRERRTSALIGLAVGAGLAALLVPESGRDVRRRISDTLHRRGAGVEDSVEREAREPQEDPVA